MSIWCIPSCFLLSHSLHTASSQLLSDSNLHLRVPKRKSSVADTGSPTKANVTIYSPSMVMSTYHSTEDTSVLQTHSSRFTLLQHCTNCQRLEWSTFPSVSEWMWITVRQRWNTWFDGVCLHFKRKKPQRGGACGVLLCSHPSEQLQCVGTLTTTLDQHCLVFCLWLNKKSTCVLWFSSHQAGLLLSVLTWHQ